MALRVMALGPNSHSREDENEDGSEESHIPSFRMRRPSTFILLASAAKSSVMVGWMYGSTRSSAEATSGVVSAEPNL